MAIKLRPKVNTGTALYDDVPGNGTLFNDDVKMLSTMSTILDETDHVQFKQNEVINMLSKMCGEGDQHADVRFREDGLNEDYGSAKHAYEDLSFIGIDKDQKREPWQRFVVVAAHHPTNKEHPNGIFVGAAGYTREIAWENLAKTTQNHFARNAAIDTAEKEAEAKRKPRMSGQEYELQKRRGEPFLTAQEREAIEKKFAIELEKRLNKEKPVEHKLTMAETLMWKRMCAIRSGNIDHLLSDRKAYEKDAAEKAKLEGKDVRDYMDEQRIKSVAEFAKKHNLDVSGLVHATDNNITEFAKFAKMEPNALLNSLKEGESLVEFYARHANFDANELVRTTENRQLIKTQLLQITPPRSREEIMEALKFFAKEYKIDFSKLIHSIENNTCEEFVGQNGGELAVAEFLRILGSSKVGERILIEHKTRTYGFAGEIGSMLRRAIKHAVKFGKPRPQPMEIDTDAEKKEKLSVLAREEGTPSARAISDEPRTDKEIIQMLYDRYPFLYAALRDPAQVSDVNAFENFLISQACVEEHGYHPTAIQMMKKRKMGPENRFEKNSDGETTPKGIKGGLGSGE
jgi:hypothetical protein